MQTRYRYLVGICGLIIGCSCLHGQPSVRPGGSSGLRSEPFSFRQSASYSLSADLEAGGALTGYDVFRAESRLDYREVLGPGHLFMLGASYEYSKYGFDGPLANAVFDTVDTYAFTGRYVFPLEGEWSAAILGTLKLAAADGAKLTDGMTMSGVAGATYAFSPSFKMTFGAFVAKRLENNLLAFPIISIDWSITDRLKLRTYRGAFLTYDVGVDRATQLDMSVEYQSQYFAVENFEGTMFMMGTQEGAVKESAIVGTLGVKHNFSDVFSLRAFAEFATRREFEFRRDDRKVFEVEADSTVTFGVEGGLRF